MATVLVKPSSDRSQSWIDRSLSLVADVRAGEGAGALLLAANVFALLAFYYVLKTVRESLILSEGGAEVKSYASAGQALLLLHQDQDAHSSCSSSSRSTTFGADWAPFPRRVVWLFWSGGLTSNVVTRPPVCRTGVYRVTSAFRERRRPGKVG